MLKSGFDGGVELLRSSVGRVVAASPNFIGGSDKSECTISTVNAYGVLKSLTGDEIPPLTMPCHPDAQRGI